MKVDVTLCVSDIVQEALHHRTAIVVDSLRATSSILTALSQGCQRVIPVKTVGQALQYNGQPHTLLIGERYGKKVNGFDLTNSPLQISQQQLTDKTVVITSTNGTKAINKVKRADHVLMGAFLNASHCVKKACSFKQDIMIICAGRRGKFAIEDGLTAGFMIRQLRQLNPSLELSDMSMLLEHNYECQQDHLHSLIERGATGQTLIESQQEKDIHYCLQLNRLSITGILNGEEIIPVLD